MVVGRIPGPEPIGGIRKSALSNRLRRVTPSGVAGTIRSAARAYGSATSGLREMPDFLVIGAKKGGHDLGGELAGPASAGDADVSPHPAAQEPALLRHQLLARSRLVPLPLPDLGGPAAARATCREARRWARARRTISSTRPPRPGSVRPHPTPV